VARGVLRVYLGAAPGVGKSYAMLDEGWRRKQRGTDVVIGVIETHNRPNTIAQVRDLEIVPRRRIEYRGAKLDEMDVDAVLARRPNVAVVDELAHTNVPGSRNEKRWQDIEELLNAGINVISTVNVQHLESLNDVVEKITGIVQRETVPDSFVRSADQIELVDMSPEALRRRMAHGNVYAPERIDAALANYFRPGNLSALRELALLWVADRVEDTLQEYLADHGVTDAWETRERVVVAITGAPSGDSLIRRAARMAARTKGELRGVRVVASDGRVPSDGEEHLVAQRKLLKELGGTYHEIVGEDVAATLVDFARAERATQLVLGATRRSRRQELAVGSVIGRVLRIAGPLDVHVIAAESVAAPRMRRARARSPLPPRRLLTAWIVLLVGAPVLTALLLPFRDDIDLSTVLLAFLALAVAVAALGGLFVGAVAGIVGFTLSDLIFIAPYGDLAVHNGEEFVALVFFIAVVLTVAAFVDRVARLHWETRRSRAQVAALARSTADLVAANDPVPRLVEHVRSELNLDCVAVLVSEGAGWSALAASGMPIPAAPDDGTSIELDTSDVVHHHALVVRGRPLTAGDHETLRTIADQITVAIDSHALAAQADRADTLQDVDALRTALLQAVSHDLRTPLATIKAYVSGLRQPDVTWTPEELAEAHAAIDTECDRLNRLVSNLLDAGRLQAGALAVAIRPTAVEEPIAAAASQLPSSRVKLDIPAGLPLVCTDPTLLERALANLLTNADRHSPSMVPIVVDAQLVGDRVHVRVVDRGPGIPEDQRESVFQPFQRLHDTTSEGTGLGLAITRGFIDATGAALSLDDTPGGGLTATIVLPLAEDESAADESTP
jgi:two-component system, OmpR family, sensor histidine kinase KdpD